MGVKREGNPGLLMEAGKEGAHLQGQPGKGYDWSMGRAEEMGAGVPAPVN